MVPPPPALRRYVGFARLSARSLEAVARVVERDEDFRARVAAAVDEAQVGRAGWLWLARPEGWREQLDELEAAAAAEAAGAREARAERSATKQLAAAREAARRADAQVAAQRVELEGLRAQLAHEQAARVAAEARAVGLDERVAELTVARAEVVRKLKDTEARLVDRATEVNAARARIRALEAEGREGRAPEPPEAEAGERRSPDAEPPPPPAPTTTPPPPATAPGADDPSCLRPAAGAGIDPTALAGEVARAADGAAGLAAALGDLARLLAGGPVPPPEIPPSRGAVHRDGGPPGRPGAAETVDPGAPRARRLPLALPGGLFDDTVEAAEHLLRTPGGVLIVDGYNVTMAGWPQLPAADQRRRLVVALSDLAARTSTRVELVFDGAEVEPLRVPAPTRQLVRVRFSEPGIEADDVVIDLVGRIPAATPVIVASSDNRVRAGASRRGANLLHARQLLALVRR